MKEELITFETAKLAKERSFCWSTSNCYFVDRDSSDIVLQERNIAYDYNNWSDNTDDNYLVSAPTQSLLQKWLREKHKIHITVYSKSQESWMFRVCTVGQNLENGIYGEDYEEFEEALEESLQEALKLIKW